MALTYNQQIVKDVKRNMDKMYLNPYPPHGSLNHHTQPKLDPSLLPDLTSYTDLSLIHI